MNDLSITIKLARLDRLERIAKCAAIMSTEFNPYISLAMCVEQVLETLPVALHSDLAIVFNACASKFPDLHSVQHQLVVELVANGNLSVVDENLLESTKPEPIPATIKEVITPSNVVNIFTKTPVDNDDNL